MFYSNSKNTLFLIQYNLTKHILKYFGLAILSPKKHDRTNRCKIIIIKLNITIL